VKRYGKYGRKSRLKCEMIWKTWKKVKSNSDEIWTIWMKSSLKCEMVCKIWKKGKLNNDKIWTI
jgi:hypothetical protein